MAENEVAKKQEFTTGLSQWTNTITGLVSRDFEQNGVQYDEYSKQCAMNAMGAIFQLVQNTDKVDMNNLNNSNLREVVAQCASSDLRNELNTDLRKKIESELGTDSLVEFERNLLSLDGQTEYGTCRDFVSLISVDEYRKYRKLLPNTERWWWTLTPDSTPCNNDGKWLRVVSPSGSISGDYCFNSRGVRPVCIFSSSIFESEE